MPLGDFITWLALAVTALGVVVAAAPGLRAPLWVLAGLLGWAWSRDFAGVDPGQIGLWITTAAAAVAVDHFTGTPAAKRMAVPGPARASILGGALLGAAALGPLGVLLGTTAGGVIGLAAAGYGLPARGGGRRAAVAPWFGALVQAGASVAMAAWLVARVLAV